MAEAKDAEAPAPKKKKLLIIVIAAAVVVLIIAGVGIALMMKSSHKAADAEAEGDTAETAHETKKETPPVYVKLEMFTTNLAMEGAEQQNAQYIQVAVELKVETAPDGESLKLYMPEIRNSILRLLSSKKASELSNTPGKDALADEIREAVNTIVGGSGKSGKKGAKAKGPVATVLFSSFIIQ